MLPSCTKETFCGFFLAALALALGWGLGNFLVSLITRLIVRLLGLG